MSTDNPSRPEDEEPDRTARGGPVDAGGAPAAEGPSPETQAPAPMADADGGIPAAREEPVQIDTAAAPVRPQPLGPGVGTATPLTGTSAATPRTGMGAAAPQPAAHAPGTAGTGAAGPLASDAAASPARPAPDGEPGRAAPASDALSAALSPGGPATDPLSLEKPEPLSFASGAEPHDEAAGSPVEDTAVRRRSLLTAAQSAPEGTPDAVGPAPDAPAAPATAVPGASGPASPAPTTGASTEGGAGGRSAADGAEPRNRTSRTRSRSHRADAVDDDVLLDGSIVVGRPKSRAGAHWAGVLVSVVALPVAWFFLHDGAAMATVRSPDSYAFDLSARGLTELAVGALALVIAMWVARLTSVGSITVGVISMLLGLPFLVAPGVMTDAFSPFLGDLSTQSALGQSLSTYLWTDAVTGKFLVLGVFMAMLGVVSHSARRAGRHEQEVIERGHRAED